MSQTMRIAARAHLTNTSQRVLHPCYQILQQHGLHHTQMGGRTGQPMHCVVHLKFPNLLSGQKIEEMGGRSTTTTGSAGVTFSKAENALPSKQGTNAVSSRIQALKAKLEADKARQQQATRYATL